MAGVYSKAFSNGLQIANLEGQMAFSNGLSMNGFHIPCVKLFQILHISNRRILGLIGKEVQWILKLSDSLVSDASNFNQDFKSDLVWVMLLIRGILSVKVAINNKELIFIISTDLDPPWEVKTIVHDIKHLSSSLNQYQNQMEIYSQKS